VTRIELPETFPENGRLLGVSTKYVVQYQEPHGPTVDFFGTPRNEVWWDLHWCGQSEWNTSQEASDAIPEADSYARRARTNYRERLYRIVKVVRTTEALWEESR
jgi:hypothetical protein